MASALMRRSALTAVLAAAATVFSPLTGLASAAAPALTAPTYSPGCNQLGSCTATANQPQFKASYNTALDPASTATIVDTSASNADVPCTKTVSGSDISCTPNSSLVDGHVYKVTFSVKNSDDSSSRTDTNNWTEDIPSLSSISPKDGDVVGAGNTQIKATYDEALDATSSITITDKDGNALSGGSLSASNPAPNSPKDTIAYTPPTLPDGTYFVHVHANASGNTAAYADTYINYTVNSTTPQAAPTVTTGGYSAIDGSHWINGINEKAVPFSGTAEPNVRVKVVIYDPNVFDPSGVTCTKGLDCTNDRSATVGVAPCATPTVVGGVNECPWSLTIDTSTSGGTPDSEPYKYYAIAYTAGGSLKTGDTAIGKDTSAPANPTKASANSVGKDGMLTVTGDDADSSVKSYRFVATDALKQSVADDLVTVAGHGCPSGPGVTAQCATDSFDVSALQDGEDDYGTDSTTGNTQTVGSSVAPGLTVDVYARDLAGNLSSKKSTSADKESTDLTADLSKSYVKLADGSTVPFASLSPSASSVPSVTKPTAVVVWFNELIRKDATKSALFGSSAYTTNLQVLSRTGFPIAGSPTITDGGFSLTWTLSSTATDAGSPYSVANLLAVAGSCPDDGVDKTATQPGSGNGYCETYSNNGPLARFAIDTIAPNVHVTGVNGTGVNNGIDATNIAGTVFSGTVDADATQVSLTVQSANGGNAFVPASSVTITAPAAGQTLATWQSSPVNLSGLQDGTVTMVPRAADGAGNASSLDPTVNNPDGTGRSSSTTMQARPTAPQGLSAFGQNGQILVSWTPPASNGGHALTGYTLTVTDTTISGSPQSMSVAPTATSQLVSNLVNGHLYSVSLTAANDIGSGPAATTSATPKGAAAISLSAPSVLTYGQSGTLRGKLTYLGTGLGNEKVTITPYIGSKAGAAKSVTTDSLGNFALTVKPSRTMQYNVAFAGDSAYGPASNHRLIKVRVAIKITKLSASSRSHLVTVTLTGYVKPKMHGRTVYIYEVIKGKNHRLAGVKLSSKSTWVYRHKFSKGKHVVFANFRTQNAYYGNNSSKVRFSRS